LSRVSVSRDDATQRLPTLTGSMVWCAASESMPRSFPMPQMWNRSRFSSIGFERIVFSSDAVIAIAITLRIRKVRLPDWAVGFILATISSQ
jgi:hypothetical protein